MDFLSLILFLILYFIRPQEWLGFLANVRPVQIVMIFALIAMLLRPRGFQLRDYFRTPHDWMIYAYIFWIVFATGSWWGTFNEVLNLLVIYIVTVQGLSNCKRMETYIWWWVSLLFTVSLLAVAGNYGFDPMHSQEVTAFTYRSRLVLNTSLTNNPNALGHTVVPLIPMLYLLFFWERGIVARSSTVCATFIPLWCLYLTQSKGSYLSGGATIVLSLMFGRKRWVQIVLTLLALAVGQSLLLMLPRMNELKKARADAGIAGRLFAFRFGLETMDRMDKGIGYLKFEKMIEREKKWRISSHSSYVNIGAELGKFGLFLWIGVLYCGIRSLVTARCRTVQEERIRRVLFAAHVAYIFSGWMVAFPYRATFFFQTAVIAALHRHLLKYQHPDESEVPANDSMTGDTASGEATSEILYRPTLPSSTPAGEETPFYGILRNWNRITLTDLLLMLILTVLAIRFWRYIVMNGITI